MADETRSAQILIRMKPSLKEAAQKAADEDSRSLSSLVEKLLVEHLKTKGYAAIPRNSDRTARARSDAKGMAHVEIEKALVHSDEPIHVKERRKRILTEVPADLRKDRRPK
jgi:hypothetical protein